MSVPPLPLPFIALVLSTCASVGAVGHDPADHEPAHPLPEQREAFAPGEGPANLVATNDHWLIWHAFQEEGMSVAQPGWHYWYRQPIEGDVAVLAFRQFMRSMNPPQGVVPFDDGTLLLIDPQRHAGGKARWISPSGEVTIQPLIEEVTEQGVSVRVQGAWTDGVLFSEHRVSGRLPRAIWWLPITDMRLDHSCRVLIDPHRLAHANEPPLRYRNKFIWGHRSEFHVFDLDTMTSCDIPRPPPRHPRSPQARLVLVDDDYIVAGREVLRLSDGGRVGDLRRTRGMPVAFRDGYVYLVAYQAKPVGKRDREVQYSISKMAVNRLGGKAVTIADGGPFVTARRWWQSGHFVTTDGVRIWTGEKWRLVSW